MTEITEEKLQELIFEVVVDYLDSFTYNKEEVLHKIKTNDSWKQILDGQKALEELSNIKERYSQLLNLKAITGKDQDEDMKIVRSAIQDAIQILNQFKGHYDKYPNYTMRWDEAREIIDSELSKINSELRQENNQLKELKKRIEEFLKHRCHGSDIYYGYTLDPILLQILGEKK